MSEEPSKLDPVKLPTSKAGLASSVVQKVTDSLLEPQETDSAAKGAVKAVTAAAASGAAKGAAVGGAAGAAAGAAKSAGVAVLRNKESRKWVLVVVGVLVMLQMLIPSVAVFAFAAFLPAKAQDSMESTRVASSVETFNFEPGEVSDAMTVAKVYDLPWVLVLALNREAEGWDEGAVAAELKRLDPTRSKREIGEGLTVNNNAASAVYQYAASAETRQLATKQLFQDVLAGAGIENGATVVDLMMRVALAEKPVCDGSCSGASFANIPTVGDWANPVVAPTTSTFGPRGCVAGWCGANGLGNHDGHDLGAPGGTPYFAVHDGEVIDVLPEHGGVVVWDEANQIIVWYWHSSKWFVQKGDMVKAGQNIGLVGNRGFSSGDHLHIEIRVNAKKFWYSGTPVDPYEFFLSKGITLGVG